MRELHPWRGSIVRPDRGWGGDSTKRKSKTKTTNSIKQGAKLRDNFSFKRLEIDAEIMSFKYYPRIWRRYREKRRMNYGASRVDDCASRREVKWNSVNFIFSQLTNGRLIDLPHLTLPSSSDKSCSHLNQFNGWLIQSLVNSFNLRLSIEVNIK